MKWLRQTKWIYRFFIVVIILRVDAQKQHKRQIYREQLLPALGGKIPEEAFRTDRLALNRLNKDGITVIDGVLLEAREHEKNPDAVRSKPDIIQVYVTQDSRYVPPEGRYHNDRPKSIDTTYVIRKPIGDHRDQSEKTRQGVSKLSTTQRSNDLALTGRTNSHTRTIDNTNNNHNIGASPSLRSLRDPLGGSSPPKAHGYANFHRFIPPISDNRLSHQQQHYRTIYQPIVSPLVIPTRDMTRTESNSDYTNQYDNRDAVDLTYTWDPFYRQTSQPIFFDDSDGFFFDPHQIITNYEGLFNNFHGRYYRHVGSSNKNSQSEANFRFTKKERSLNDGSGGSKSQDSVTLTVRTSFPPYTDLTSIPETSFSCGGRTGTFADIETRCQAFHECSGRTKTSSLCPVGTAYSSIKKRCEWWNTVTCGLD